MCSSGLRFGGDLLGFGWFRPLHNELQRKLLSVIIVICMRSDAGCFKCFFQVYRTIGQKYGVEYSEDEILMRYRRAYAQPWGRSRLR